MPEKSDRNNDYLEQNRSKGDAGASDSEKQKRKKVVILVCLIAVVLAVIGIGCVYLFNAGLGIFSTNAQVTVTFDSTGGSAIESQTILKGEKLTEVGSPARSGYVFAGWYYEEAPINAYSEDDAFSEDTMLYAAWYEPEMETDIEEYIDDCDSDITFIVHSNVEIADDNLTDYIGFSCLNGEDGRTLSVQAQDDGYLLYMEDGFTPGYTYSIEILDTKTVYFIKAGNEYVSDQAVNTYNFTIYRDNVNNVVMKADPKLLSTNDVSEFEEAGEVADGETGNENDNGKTIYHATLVTDGGDYQVGDIVSLGSGDVDADENQYYKVIGVVNNDSDCYLDLITPNLGDVYSELEVYYSGDAVYFENVEKSEETRAIEQNMQTSLKESEGYNYVCRSIADGVLNSPTLLKTVSTMSHESQKQFAELSAEDLVELFKNVRLSLTIQRTKDELDNENGVHGNISFTTGNIDIKLDENIKLTLNLSMENDITAVEQGFISNNADLSLNIYEWIEMTNKCSITFNAVISTTGGNTINITEEIQNLIDSQSDDKTQEVVDSLNSENFFGDDLSYVTILEQELAKQTVSIYHVLTIEFKLNFHVDIGMRVGLTLNFENTEVRMIGLSNIEAITGQSGMATVNERLSSHTSFSAILKGQVGIRAGFKAEVNFSLVHLNPVANFGFTADLGVYEEISGFVRFDYDSDTGMLVSGGLKSETGVYVELEFVWCLFGIDGGVSIAEMKFPILTIGSLEFASEFNETESAVTFNTTSYNLKSSEDTDLLKLKYINIDTSGGAATINIKPASLSGDYAFYLAQDTTGKGSKDDLKYVTVDDETGMVTIADGAPDRLDFTVVVQYTKGCSLFSNDTELITKNINCTYMKYEVTNSTQKYMATFYFPNGSVMEQKEYYVGQVPVPPAEDMYEDLFILSEYTIVDWTKPWQENIAAIYEDTSYHLNYELNYKDITFYGDVYDADTGTYQYGVIAVVPTLVGAVPVAPEVTDAKLGWEFYNWSPELRDVQTDYSYTAMYMQDPDYCLYHFYVNGNSISSGFVKIGDTPVAPDMSAYNTDDQKFVGWWPSVGATSSNYQTYYAVFKKYVNVTFKDADGNILSEQRVLAGTTPEAPEVDDVVEGEEDYYEYHFNRWATEEGTKLGVVYSDTVYSPVYDTIYLEVTTTFDADGHTFADGTTIKEYKGVYANSQYASRNILNLPEVTYQDNENTYTVDYWQSTEKLNGSYVKLYMSDSYTYYKYNLTFTPVFKSEPIEYTVWFDGGDEEICLTGHYGDLITSDMLTGLKKTSTNSNYYYELSDYGLTLPYRFGTVLGTDGLPAQYISVVAKFKLVGVDKTYTFDANGGEFSDGETVKTVVGPYASYASFTAEPEKAEDEQYMYQFAGWSEDKDAASGESYSNFRYLKNTTLYAVYTKTPKHATLTFYSVSGHFTDGSTQKTVQVLIGESAPAFDEIPLKDKTAYYEYTFTGWDPSYQPGTVVTSSASYYAQYSAQEREYTVTFDAGSGYFEGGTTIINQTYHYGDTIVPPSDPMRDGGTGYEYEFSAWSPSLATGTTVTWSRTFTATYHMVGTGGVEETGIIVTKDGVSEDINVNGTTGVGQISGYKCELVDYGGTEPVPTLTVTGDDLTFNGSSSEVFVVIAASATNVTFDDLTLSGAYSTGVLTTGSTSVGLTVNISGTCVIGNTETGEDTVRFERPISLEGTGTGAKLLINGKGSYTLYCADDFDVNSLELVIDSTNAAIGNDEGSGEEWKFTDSTIRLNAASTACGTMHDITIDDSSLTATGGLNCTNLVVSGASEVDVSVSGEEEVAIGMDGDLTFADFTGTFSASSIHSTSPGAAVMAYGSIAFKEGGTVVSADGYNLGGTQIADFEDAYSGTYASFGINSSGTLIPASTVTVSKS